MFLVTETEARKYWKNIRQEYGKQVKKMQGRSGDGAEDEIVCQWPYLTNYIFLNFTKLKGYILDSYNTP